MELGTWEEAGHTSKASKVWATGGILIAWPAHKSKHYNSALSRIQTRVSKVLTYLTMQSEEKKLILAKEHEFTNVSMLYLNQAT